jgi:segregation and condensation protein A
LGQVAFPALNEGIEILVELAQQGRIDPWNVDLVKVADEYLAYVSQHTAPTSATRTLPAAATFAVVQEEDRPLDEATLARLAQQQQLRLTGKTLWYLAVLLRMKSDLLSGLDPFAADEPEELYEDADLGELVQYDEWGNPISTQMELPEVLAQQFRQRFGSLEGLLQRKSSSKQARIRSVTLEDLIGELRRLEAEDLEAKRHGQLKAQEQRRRKGMRDYGNLSTEAISDLAHAEFQEDTVQAIRQVLETHLPPSAEARMSLEDLVDLSDEDGIACYLALLFLEARSVVCLGQESFYGDELSVAWDEQVLRA